MRKKIMIYILMAVGTLFLLTGCKKNVGTPEDNAVTDESDDKKEDTDQEKKVFGFCGIDMSNPFYATLKDSVQSALEEQGDKLLIKDPAGDAERQNTQIQELIEEDVDAVFLCPVDWKKIEPALDALEEADIPVINLDTKVYESGKVAAFVGSDNRNAGYVCGEDLVERKPDGGQVVIVENLNVNSVCERITGFEEAVSKGAFEVVKRIQTGNDVSGLKQQVAQVLAQNPDGRTGAGGNYRSRTGKGLCIQCGWFSGIKKSTGGAYRRNDGNRGSVTNQSWEKSGQNFQCSIERGGL